MTEQYSGGEVLSQPQLASLLNAVGNHEAKLLTLATITAFPETWFTRMDLWREIISRQGSPPEWMMAHGNPLSYCFNSFEPIGAVTRQIVDGERGHVVAVQASEFGKEWGLPFTGMMLEWASTHPGLPLQHIFGSTVTHSHSAQRAPEARYQLYQTLLDKPYEETSSRKIEEMFLANGFGAILGNHLAALQHRGVLELRSKLQVYNPTFVITDTEYRGRSVRYDELDIHTRVIYDTAERAYWQGKMRHTVDDFLDLCQQSQRASLDMVKVRSLLLAGLRNEVTHLPNLKLVTKGDVPSSYVKGVKINPEHVQALQALISGLRDVSQGVNTERYASFTRDVISDPTVFSRLIRQAKQNSSYAKVQEQGYLEALNARIVGVIQRLGELTTKQVVEEIGDIEPTLGQEAIKRALRNLTKQSKLEAVLTKKSPNKKATVLAYRLPTESRIET